MRSFILISRKEKILGVFNRFEKAVKHVQNKAEEGLFYFYLLFLTKDLKHI
jgi:hypothetical protein